MREACLQLPSVLLNLMSFLCYRGIVSAMWLLPSKFRYSSLATTEIYILGQLSILFNIYNMPCVYHRLQNMHSFMV